MSHRIPIVEEIHGRIGRLVTDLGLVERQVRKLATELRAEYAMLRDVLHSALPVVQSVEGDPEAA